MSSKAGTTGVFVRCGVLRGDRRDPRDRPGRRLLAEHPQRRGARVAVQRDHPAPGKGQQPAAGQLAGVAGGAHPLGEPGGGAEAGADGEHRGARRLAHGGQGVRGGARVGAADRHARGSHGRQGGVDARRHRGAPADEHRGTAVGRAQRQAGQVGERAGIRAVDHLSVAEGGLVGTGPADHGARAQPVELAGEVGSGDEQRDAEPRRGGGAGGQVDRVARGHDDGARRLQHGPGCRERRRRLAAVRARVEHAATVRGTGCDLVSPEVVGLGPRARGVLARAGAPAGGRPGARCHDTDRAGPRHDGGGAQRGAPGEGGAHAAPGSGRGCRRGGGDAWQSTRGAAPGVTPGASDHAVGTPPA